MAQMGERARRGFAAAAVRGGRRVMAIRRRDLLWRLVTRGVWRTILSVNIWYPTLFIAPIIGYHPIMLASNVFGFAGGEGSELGCVRRWGERAGARPRIGGPVGRSPRVNVAATLSNWGNGYAPKLGCEMFAVTVNRPGQLPDSSVCRVSDGVSGYGDDLMNSERIADWSGDSEFGLSLMCPNLSRPVRPIAASLNTTPQEADPRQRNTRVRTPCGAPGQENYTSWCVSGFSQVFVPKV
ncbi:hypothetical protein NONI108955_25365 [Nocardia ninae]